METLTLIQNIKKAAGKLKNSKLKKITVAEPFLESIKIELQLANHAEAMMLVALFDRQCVENATTIEDLSDYFGCSTLDIMEFVPDLQSLMKQGYTKSGKAREKDILEMDMEICHNVFMSIVEGRTVSPVPVTSNTNCDQFDFCQSVYDRVEERSSDAIDTEKLLSFVLRLEDEYSSLDFVRTLQDEVRDIEARVQFYYMCHHFCDNLDNNETQLNTLVNSVYERILDIVKVKNQFLENQHVLIKTGLVALKNADSVKLTNEGLQRLFGDAAKALGKNYTCVDRYDFINKVHDVVDELDYEPSTFEFIGLHADIEKMEKQNEISFVVNLNKIISEVEDRALFYLICYEKISGDDFVISQLSSLYSKRDVLDVKRSLKNKTHILQKLDLIELTKGAIFEGEKLELTDKGKQLFLEEDYGLFEESTSEKDIINHKNIVEKRLFFEPKLQTQLDTLKHSLEEENYQRLCEKLKANKFPTGIAVLLYGLPGTGKTESVMQIARATGRSIMHVDISSTKTCWFGESEKLIKQVFEDYRKLCSRNKIKPILLFNEADAVFAKRKDNTSGNVAQTENAIQNIILEEMEKLDGILIATTNLAENLDKAFERRFLFKIFYNKPTLESKKYIWRDKLSILSDTEAMMLASSYDFSGGEIENVVRKLTIEEVINNVQPSFDRVQTLCSEEKIGNSINRIGFLN